MSSGLLAFAPMSEDVVVDRTVAGAYVDGNYVEGASSSFTVTASVQPMSQREQLILPEGVRERKSIILFTTVELKVVDEETGTSADVVNYLGEKYEVFQTPNYRMGVLDHFRIVALKENE